MYIDVYMQVYFADYSSYTSLGSAVPSMYGIIFTAITSVFEPKEWGFSHNQELTDQYSIVCM